jgi:hypothetical protein
LKDFVLKKFAYGIKLSLFVTITFFFFFSREIKYKIHLIVHKLNVKFYFDILIHPKDTGNLIFPIFLTVHIRLQPKVDNFCTAYSQSCKTFRFVRISYLV